MQYRPLPESNLARAVDCAVRPTRLIAYAWGDKYVDELLTLTLPAILASDNLPYLVSMVPCEVALLIEERWHSRVSIHPTVEHIRRLCPVRLIGLDDIIPDKDKYGMSLTYALHRGFADLGSAVTESYLLFLNADFIVANGSFRQVLGALMRGERLVAAPSYCVVSRNVKPEMQRCIDPDSGALTISPRALARIALRNLHDTVRGKTLNQERFHLRQMDQFYWQLDAETLLGHQMPVAIVGMRPERHVKEPNSYWDHGLMREFCPYAEPYVLGDSDYFLMVELREREVAQDQIVAGPPDAREAGERMIGWVTPYQREFAKYPLTLHTTDLMLPSVAAGRSKLAACVREILAHSPRVLPSHLDHPQWNYHWAAFTEARHKHLSTQLGIATATQPPPKSFSDIDQAWWKLDGLIKSYERKRAELEKSRTDRMHLLQDLVSKLLGETDQRRAEINARFVDEFPGHDDTPAVVDYFQRELVQAGVDTVADTKDAQSGAKVQAGV